MSGATTRFEPGLALARRFFENEVEPAVTRLAPDLAFGAALIGDGSEVLGFDDAISADHDWGPRVLLFLGEADFARHAEPIVSALEGLLPDRFGDWPTRFFDCDRRIGVDPAARSAGSEAHGVEVHTLGGWLERQLGIDAAAREPTPAQWSGLAEQALLAITEGAVFRDDFGELAAVRRRLGWFPRDVQLQKMAHLWAEADSEMPFLGRAGDAGDDRGARIICARQAERAMRLCFLIDRRYAPYSKWFGTAFSRLPSAAAVAPHLDRALAAPDWAGRETALGAAFEAVARRQLPMGIPGAREPRLSHYFSRPYLVINAGEIAAAIRGAVDDPSIGAPREKEE